MDSQVDVAGRTGKLGYDSHSKLTAPQAAHRGRHLMLIVALNGTLNRLAKLRRCLLPGEVETVSLRIKRLFADSTYECDCLPAWVQRALAVSGVAILPTPWIVAKL